jgi:hypothetical protein
VVAKNIQVGRKPSGKLFGRLVVFGALAVVSGCAADRVESAEQQHVGRAIQPIINGVASGTEHDAVIVLTNFVNGVRRNLCSATLVAPNLVITARHCVSDTESSAACTDAGTAITGAAVKADRAPANLAVFVGKNGVAPNSEELAGATAIGSKIVVEASVTTVCNADIAFLVLDKKIEGATYAPIRLSPPTMAEKVSAVGWGVDETGALPKQREIRSNLSLIGVGPGLYPENPDYGYGNSEFMIGESACSGDSGGPSLSAKGAVLGVASRAGNGQPRDPNNYATTCMGAAAHAVYTHLGNHKDLVTRAFQEAGEPIWLEGEPDPRAPKPQATPSTQAPPANEKKAGSSDGVPLPPAPSAGAEDAEAEAGGCSMSSEPQSGAVEYALGLVGVFGLIVALRRRYRKLDLNRDGGRDGTHRDRMPTIP